VDFDHTYRVGKYGVDMAAIDAGVNTALGLEPDVDIYFVDEIGKMECMSQQFINSMRILLNSDKLVIATISKKGSGFIEEVKQRNDISLWEVTRANRNKLPDKILAWLGTRTEQ
jgi:nucleoside-triphosphatase